MSSDDFFDSIQRESDERLANPLPFALDALQDLFGHRDDVEEGFQGFQFKLENALWWADDAVRCLALVLDDPPADFGKLVREQAHVTIVKIADGGLHVFDEAETEQWVREAVPRLRQMYDTFVAEKTTEQLRERGEG